MIVSLENFTPGVRYDGNVWTRAAIEEAPSAEGPWTRLEVQNLVPLDTDPRTPQSRDFTTTLAEAVPDWFRIVWIDANGLEQDGPASYSAQDPIQQHGETALQLLEQAIDVTGFDVDRDTTGLMWLNMRHRTMVQRSRWLRQRVVLATSVSGQASYVWDPNVVELYELTIGGATYVRGRRQDILSGRASRLLLSPDVGGVFVPDADESGLGIATIYPTVDAGLPVVGFAAVLPQDLTLEDRPVVPPDFNRALIEGVQATGFAMDSEQVGVADRFEQRFDVACEELRQLGRRRFRGPGPAQIRVVGVNA